MRVLIIVLILMVGSAQSWCQQLMTDRDGSIRTADGRAMVVFGDVRFIATKDSVYRAIGADGKWESVFAMAASQNEILCMKGKDGTILIGTKRGMYRSDDAGYRWRNIFKVFVSSKGVINCVDISTRADERILIGTDNGVYVSDLAGGRWKDISNNLKSRKILSVMLGEDSMYAGTSDGLYLRKGADDIWEKIFAVHGGEEVSTEAPDEPSDDGDGEVADGVVNIAAGHKAIYIATGNSIMVKDAAGDTWRSVGSDSLKGIVNRILLRSDPDELFCATSKGIYEYDRSNGWWREIYRGTGKGAMVRDLALSANNAGRGILWAVSDSGFKMIDLSSLTDNTYADVEIGHVSPDAIFAGEPTFRELQQAAIKYAEVDDEKIRGWRRNAQISAVMPKVSVGLDRNKSNSYDIYTSATKDYVVTGPDDISDGLDVSLSWELGDLIWNDAQTSIDVRSRLMVQLRNDILDDLRRLYYERKRLQYEVMANPPKNDKARFDKDMRIMELTQAIDDLTGNYLSDHMKK